MLSNDNFGPLIAYLVPGTIVLLGLSQFSPAVRVWFAATPADAPTVGGFLYLTLASLAAGMTVSALRWALVDTRADLRRSETISKGIGIVRSGIPGTIAGRPRSRRQIVMHPVRVGTCGWSYKDWSGVFYPEGLPALEQLPFYAERFPVVEVDATFYHSPAIKTVQGWRDRTPDGFGFSLKVPQSITHEKQLQDCQADLHAFLTAARALEDKLLCCLLQFGYFNRSAFSSVDRFLERLNPFLDGWPKDVPVAVEIRNKAWIVPKLLDCLRAHGVVLTLADQAWMPTPLELVKRLDMVTGPFGYVRLLGHREQVEVLTSTLGHIVIDRSEQIRDDAETIHLLSERVPVLTFVNNHFAGYSPHTVRQLLDRLEDRRQ